MIKYQKIFKKQNDKITELEKDSRKCFGQIPMRIAGVPAHF